MRIAFRVVPEGDYSVVAKQAAGTLSEFVTQGGREILLVESGIVPSKEMFTRAAKRNSMLAWALRGGRGTSVLIGASRAEQVAENVRASGVIIPGELMARIDEILGDSPRWDPALTFAGAPQRRPV